MTTTTVARWYPNQPPKLPGETADDYTNRLLGAGGHTYPYDHRRGRQCSIGYHEECSDRLNSGECGCPCHEERRDAWHLVDNWNKRYPTGTAVTLPDAPDEPPTRTIGPARMEAIVNRTDSWPVVPLEGFPHPVRMSWLRPEGSR